MPFFAFLRCGGPSSTGRRTRRGESAFDTRSPRSSAVPLRSDDCHPVARCSEKGSGFLGVPGLSFFGSKESQAPASEPPPKATETQEKARQDAVARENEEVPEPAKKPQLTQPIPFEQFGREWMNISGQDTFDGFRLEGAKQVNKYLQTCHSFCLGTQLRESGYSYQFGPTLAISAPPDPSQGENAQPPPPHFFAMAKLGTDGSLQGRLIKTLCQSADFKLNFNSSLKDEQRNFYEISLDNTGQDWASSLKLAWQCRLRDNLRGKCNPPVYPFEQQYVMSLFGANGASMLALGGRYNLDKQSVISCNLSQQPDFKSPAGLTKLTHSCKVQYTRKVTDRLSMGTELEYSHPETESALRLGWEYLFRQARVQGLIDTCGRVSVFAQDYNGFGVSGLIDYWRGTYKFGFLMHVVPPPDAAPPQSG
ncbi:eukaryotic porin domain-containing protein, putative [Eimeria mitis]|uniref:Eukaryotic porin domain-containing protein, putative n=1 Tax=Eimeria mitis TaxID=44415 RepID=U6JXY0_9EIME|nr:eukaryotic porin domain-containing protein, putative [Eimeria mitis]CDJ28892.1 eukaryotic porin domain-containing protein, putative [Eimeria mitis]